jgi:hypothetical protein
MSSMLGDVPVQQRTVAGAQPPGTHASQQAAKLETQALPPPGALHFEASFLTEHLVRPRRVVRQQVTNPGRPQVDFAEQPRASRTQSCGRSPDAARAAITSREHLTYWPWFGVVVHPHWAWTAALVAASAARSSGVSQRFD